MILSHNKLKPKEQLKKGILSFDLGNCAYVIKKYKNIENLIKVNIKLKYNENKDNYNDDKSFYFVKDYILDIYDYSGRKLFL